jgi:putative heme-binding domain-containing protein
VGALKSAAHWGVVCACAWLVAVGGAGRAQQAPVAHSQAPPSADSSLGAAPWESLHDGRTLDGWSGDRSFWSVEDGCIVGRSTAQHPLERTLYLTLADRSYADFELELEYELVGGNSGVQFRSAALADGGVQGLQADLEDGPSWTGGLYEQDGRGVLVRRGEQVHARADGSREALSIGDAAELLTHARVHAWNRYRIVARGPLVEVYLNGVRTSALLDQDAAHFRASGIFALQLHQGDAMQVRFRDLRVRPLGLATTSAALGPSADGGAQWIWAHAESRDGEGIVLRRRFTLPRRASRLHGRLRADNHAVLSLDGKLLARNDAWWQPTAIDSSDSTAAGPHELVIEATNDGSVGAVLGEFTFEDASGVLATLRTDATWEATLAEGSRAFTPHVFGPESASPWGPLEGGMRGAAQKVDEPLPDPARFALPEHFEAQLVYAVPRATQGSWVSLCRAPRNRMYAGDQYGALWCVTLTPAADPRAVPTVASVERVALDVSGAQGLVWAFDALYVVANSNKSGLYRLRDTDGDGRLDESKLLRGFDGDGEHGPHAVLAGPGDGKLYVMIGNHTKLTDCARSRVPRTWGEDQLLKHRNDPGGHAVGILAPCGWIARCDPDGNEFELLACGFRNAYDAAFDARGELFTYDSDMEWDMGLPWYRPTRILHVVSGADYGSRNGNAVWPAWVPDSLPATLDLGPGSPTGVLHGHELSAFPREWRERLYAADWSYGRVWAVDLAPHGASWRGEGRVFLKGKPLPVTDLEAGADGCLYVTSGGRDTQSGLWRVVWNGAAVEPRGAYAGLTKEQVKRRELSAVHGQGHAGTNSAAWRLDLDEGDPFLLQAARVDLEGNGKLADLLHALERFEDDGFEHPARQIQHAIALLHRADELAAPERERLWSRLAAWKLDGEHARPRLRVLQLAWTRLGPVPEADRARLHAALDVAIQGSNFDRERLRQALELMCVSRHPNAVQMGMIRIDCATDPVDQIAYAQALTEADSGWSDDTRRRIAKWIRYSREWTGGASFAKYVRGIHEDLARVAELAPDVLREDSVPAVAVTAAATPAVGRDWTLDELEPLLAGIVGGRDHGRGRALYESTQCIACHRIAGAGGGTGPDLSAAGARFSLRALAENVVQPSRVVSDQYRDTVFELYGGQFATGRVLGEDASSVRVLLTGLPEREEAFDVGSIVSRRVSSVSRMPEGLLKGLSADDVRDLFAYVLAGGDAGDPLFE